MTLLGKILVFLTVVLSFVMLAWAIALYTHHIDWSDAKATADRPAGELVARKARVTEANASVNLANARWREAMNGNDGKDNRPIHAGLLQWEKRRDGDRAWYAALLKAADVGPDGNGDKVIIKRIATKDGQPLPDPANPTLPALLVDAERRKTQEEPKGEPLYCFKWYEKELGRLAGEIAKNQAEQQRLAKEEEALTEQAIGPKGLRQRIWDEEGKLARVAEELKDVESRKTNSLVDTELLVRRRAQLERRVGELEKATKVKD
jgi:hypothetical protein